AHAMGCGSALAVFLNEVDYIGIDVDGVAGIEQDMAVARDLAQRGIQDRAVEKAELTGQLEPVDFAGNVLLHDMPDWSLQVAGHDEPGADDESNDHTRQKIGEYDRENGDEIRDESIPAFVPHGTDDFGTREFEARDHQDRGEAGKRNAVDRAW